MTTWEDSWRAAPTPTDKVTAHSYLPVYERLLAARRDEPLTIVEVGVLEGGSLALWARLFPNAWVFGIDIDTSKVKMAPGFGLIEQDSRDAAAARAMFPVPEIDVFIDDGDHAIESQLATLAAFRHAMKPGGLYFVEDIYPFEGHERLAAAAGRSTELFDLRSVKGRIDDVLLLIRF